MSIRRIASVAVVALAGSLVSAAPAAAFDPPTVESDTSTPGQVQVHVTGIDNSVSSVKLQLGPLTEQLVLVSNHAASATFDTWGLEGPVPLTVTQCLQPDATTCDPPIEPAPEVVVDNPEPSYTPDREGTLRTHDFTMTVGLEHEAGEPTLEVALDDGEPTLVEPGTPVDVDVDALDEGEHVVRAAVCNTDGSLCAEPTGSTFEVVRTVAAGFSLDRSVISPNGDGRFDQLTFTWSLDDPWDDGVIEISDAEQDVVRAIPVVAPTAPDTERSTAYDGTDALSQPLAEGSYTATLRARRNVDGSVVESSFQQEFSVDLTVLPVTGVGVTDGTVYPAADGYLDTTTISWTDAEDYARVDVQVLDAEGHQVRLWNNKVSSVVWNGRTGSGMQVPNGTYQVRVRSHDAVGNRVWSGQVPVKVSDKVLVTKTRSLTITPKTSRVPGGRIGDCSKWKVPSKHGWPGSASYLSNARCTGDAADSDVWTIHQTLLPAAVTYRKVQLSWYGGPTKGKRCSRSDVECDRAVATLYKSDGQTAHGWFNSVDYLTSQHLPWAKASAILQDRVVEWGFAVNGGSRYDVKSFTIRYKADVLVKPS